MNKPLVSSDTDLAEERRRTLEIEYQVAAGLFQHHNTQVWQTFAVVSTVSLLGLAFVAQLKANANAIANANTIVIANAPATWPASLTVGLGMIILLVGWLQLAKRWWAFSQAVLYRMRWIEHELGIYLIREGTWLRKNLGSDELSELTQEAQEHYQKVRQEFRDFPKYEWRQQRITSVMIIALVVIWCLLIAADMLSLF